MTDDRPGSDEHLHRVHEAFDDLATSLGERATPEVRASMEKLRSAVLERDAAGLRGHLTDVKTRHRWFYTELTLHPRVAELVNELALMGL